MPLLRPFQKEDWYQWSGCRRFGNQDPMIYDEDPRFVVILAGGDDGGMTDVFIQVGDDSTEDFQYCYVHTDASNTWADAVALGEWFATQLAANDMNAWLIVRNLCRCH